MFESLTTKNFFAKKASKFCTVTTSKLTGNLSYFIGFIILYKLEGEK